MSQIYSFDSASLVSFFANSAKVFPTNAKGYAPVSIAGISEICDELVAEFEGDDDFALKLAAPVLAVEQLLNIATASDPAIEVDESSIMTVLVDQDMGVVAKVFGPGIFALDDTTVIRFGDNFIPVQVKGDRVKVGEVVGRLHFEKVEYKDGDFLKGSLYLKVSDDTTYAVPLVFPRDTTMSPIDIVDSLEAGAPLSDFLASAKGGGGKYVKLGDLEVGGEYEIAGIDGTGNPSWGQYRIELVDGRIVSLNSALKNAIEPAARENLEKVSRRYTGKVLKIYDKSPRKDGGWDVKARVINPQPLSLGAALESSQLPSTASPKALPPANKLEAMRARLKTKAAPAEEPVAVGSGIGGQDFDKIPF